MGTSARARTGNDGEGALRAMRTASAPVTVTTSTFRSGFVKRLCTLRTKYS